eukprot:TRINITY_DN21962_c0_g1_i2.p4 TRINITY_DN21962_c0_g1~~TRINITY_DN21962_c0_g1_i2.p4  ORF type:complete len:142 (+),score=20.47 TRINITY_DN21962_c0_g1_i2:712-1137(+)
MRNWLIALFAFVFVSTSVPYRCIFLCECPACIWGKTTAGFEIRDMVCAALRNRAFLFLCDLWWLLDDTWWAFVDVAIAKEVLAVACFHAAICVELWNNKKVTMRIAAEYWRENRSSVFTPLLTWGTEWCWAVASLVLESGC